MPETKELRETKSRDSSRHVKELSKKSMSYPEPQNPEMRPIGAQPASQSKPAEKTEKK